MKNYPVVHPILFAVYAVLGILAANLEQIPPTQAIRSLIVIPLVAAAVLIALKLIVKDWHRAGFLATLAILMLLYYGHIYRMATVQLPALSAATRHLLVFGVWVLLLGAVGSPWVWRRLSNPNTITGFLDITALVALILSARTIIAFLLMLNASGQAIIPAQPPIHLGGESQPDIYYIILDGYARADVLQGIYHYDNSPFIHSLTERGFYVADQSHTNYVQTVLSLSSSLNFNYLSEADKDSVNRYPLRELIQNSRVRELLEARGYQSVSFSSGFFYTEITNADVYLSPYANTLNEFESVLLASSAADIVIELANINITYPGYDTHRRRNLFEFEQLAKVHAIDGPKFVFAHITIPHPPFVFDRNGQAIAPDWPCCGGDGDHFPGNAEEYRVGYPEQLAYVNQLVEKTVDAILANSDIPPIIILQGDHGPGMFLNWDSADKTCLKERVAIFNAYYLPGEGARRLYNSITPVNSFRLIFDTYFDTELGLLEDKSYYSTWAHPYDFVDVTSKSEIQCTIP